MKRMNGSPLIVRKVETPSAPGGETSPKKTMDPLQRPYAKRLMEIVRASERARNTEGRWRDAGLCIGCGKAPPEKDRVRCRPCLQRRVKDTTAYKKARAKRDGGVRG